jgi:ATP-binding cassette subfamily B protein
LVNENILSIGRDRTTVIVSHRLSSLTQCDQILVLDQGAVMDIADHATLLTRCALYRQLWQQQTGGEHAPVKGGDHVVFPRSAAS